MSTDNACPRCGFEIRPHGSVDGCLGYLVARNRSLSEFICALLDAADDGRYEDLHQALRVRYIAPPARVSREETPGGVP